MDTVYLARHPKRPKAMDYIHPLFPDFLELHGDRAYGDDAACRSGIADFHGRSVTVLAQSKERRWKKNMSCFGMPHRRRPIVRQSVWQSRPNSFTVDYHAGGYSRCISGKEPRSADRRKPSRSVLRYFPIFAPQYWLLSGEGGSGGAGIQCG